MPANGAKAERHKKLFWKKRILIYNTCRIHYWLVFRKDFTKAMNRQGNSGLPKQQKRWSQVHSIGAGLSSTLLFCNRDHGFNQSPRYQQLGSNTSLQCHCLNTQHQIPTLYLWQGKLILRSACLNHLGFWCLCSALRAELHRRKSISLCRVSRKACKEGRQRGEE